MKIRIIVFICAAMMMVACGGGNSQSSSSCPKKADEKACSKTCGSAKVDEKSCSKTCGGGAASTEGKCCKEGTAKAGEKCCKSGTTGSGCGNTAAETPSCCKSAGVKKIISAQVFIKPEKVDAFLAATKDLIEMSRTEEGCISYSLYQDPLDKTKFLFFEEWKNQVAVDFHFATKHFKKFGETLNECGSAPAVITIYDSVAENKI
jgi:quinol monooxygenase YgiN